MSGVRLGLYRIDSDLTVGLTGLLGYVLHTVIIGMGWDFWVLELEDRIWMLLGHSVLLDGWGTDE